MALDVQKGLTPVRKLGALPNSCGFNTYPIKNGYATAIGEGDPVKLSAGFIKIGDNAANVIGVFAGHRYIDSEGRLMFSPNFVAGTSSKGGVPVGNGLAQPLANVYDSPDQTYVIRTLLSALEVSAIGRTYRVSAIGSVVNGRSQAVLDVNATAETSGSGGYMVTVVGLYGVPDSRFGTGPVAVEVKLARYGSVQQL